ncbi:hypothetical protein [Silvibacterium bohemicum]|nr:hypothetical protein [Silvibacterium bohemicum]
MFPVQKNFQMRSFAWLEDSALIGQPTLELAALHSLCINNIVYIGKRRPTESVNCQAGGTIASISNQQLN